MLDYSRCLFTHWHDVTIDSHYVIIDSVLTITQHSNKTTADYIDCLSLDEHEDTLRVLAGEHVVVRFYKTMVAGQEQSLNATLEP